MEIAIAALAISIVSGFSLRDSSPKKKPDEGAKEDKVTVTITYPK